MVLFIEASMLDGRSDRGSDPRSILLRVRLMLWLGFVVGGSCPWISASIDFGLF